MATKTSLNISTVRIPASLIIKAGVVAGILDICFAFLYSYIKRGTNPVTVLQNVAKFVLGKETITNAVILSITGLLIHFIIALLWAALFFILYRRLNLMKINKIVTGILYGLFVWTIMNVVLLPLWSHKPFVFNPESSTINAVILILAIGMSLSLIAHQYFSKANK